jgi:uncharacterized protein involved in type VI secretion and phage assembly
VSRVNGVVIGLVLDVDDPQGEGRIRVSFPWLGPETQSGWAPIADPLGGASRGYWYMPEVGDEALVAFEHGDIDHPFVLGFLHNGVDTPPTDGIDRHVRRVQSVAGHQFDMDDRPAQESVRLRTSSGHRLEMHDPGGYIEIVTAGGEKIRLADRPGSIELSTSSGTKVNLEPTGVTIETPGDVTVTAAANLSVTAATAISVTAGASLSIAAGAAVVVNATTALVNSTAVTVNAATLLVDAPMATFTGVVACETMIATSVVSASYTPGAGNIW